MSEFVKKTLGPQPAPRLDRVQAYRVPRPVAPIDLFLDGNEGAAPPPALWDGIAGDPEILRRYPSPRALEEAWAGQLGVAPAQVLATAGADEALERTVRAFLSPGREMILPLPTFEMLDRYAAFAGGNLVPVAWNEGPYPVADVLARMTPRTAVIAVVSPNNPTGAVATADDLARLSAAAPHALLLVDLAYVEFADVDLSRAALALPNAVITRTLSKAWGLAGLRTGCVAGPEELIAAIRAAGSPYNVSGPSVALASAWLRTGGPAVEAFVATIRAERPVLAAALARLGARPLPSQANFVLARFDDPEWVRDALAGLGIAVRWFACRPGLEDALRITCPGDAVRLARVVAALESALAPEALLFDLDGVLADVGGSFRRAILETAESYGVVLAPEDIALAKAAGGANNDWDLTQRLMAARGVDVPLSEVTLRFEGFYQDTPGRAGLCRTERCLVERAWLERLARRTKLGIVTGRPKKDADRFLGDAGLADLFGTVVTMDDAPLKPDPAPVRLALERLGVRRALMIGDTPDDVRAARAAGVVPLAILAPGDDGAISRPALLGAGAARLLDSLSQLEGFLP